MKTYQKHKINKKVEKAKKGISTRFGVHPAPESWSKYTTAAYLLSLYFDVLYAYNDKIFGNDNQKPENLIGVDKIEK